VALFDFSRSFRLSALARLTGGESTFFEGDMHIDLGCMEQKEHMSGKKMYGRAYGAPLHPGMGLQPVCGCAQPDLAGFACLL
jgi:hypothetical protein